MGKIALTIENELKELEIGRIGLYMGLAGAREFTLNVVEVFEQGFKFQLTKTSWQTYHWNYPKTHPLFVCDICHSLHGRGYYDCAETQRMLSDHICFMCAIWEIRAEKENPLVISNFVYSLGPGNAGGMAGRKFDIEYFDGRQVTTNDLWAGGEVPERWRDRIPDTARFLNGAKFVRFEDGTGAFESSRQESR